VIFSSDNGPETYAYERIRRYGHRSMGPLRGLKRDLWEGGHRVPAIIRWPGKVPAGKVSDGMLSQIDWFATIAGIVGSEIPIGEAEDSIDQRALFFGTGPSARKELVHNTNPNGFALRSGNWVLIDAESGGVSKVPEWFDADNGYTKSDRAGELYDLKNDLDQHRNLHSEKPAKVMEMQERLSALRAKGRAAKGDR
jgi:arylsulfatase A